MNTSKDNNSIKIGKEEIELYPLRNHFENLLKLGYAYETAEYKESISGSVIPTDKAGLDKLEDIHDETTRAITSGIEAISEIMAVCHDEVSCRAIQDAAWVINNLSALQLSLHDAGVVLDSTSKFLDKKGASND